MIKKIKVQGIDWDLPFTEVIIDFPMSEIPKKASNIDEIVKKFIDKELKAAGGEKFKGFDGYTEAMNLDSYFIFGNRKACALFTSEETFIDHVKIHLDASLNMKEKLIDKEESLAFNFEIKDFISAFIYFRDYMQAQTFFAQVNFPDSTAIITMKYEDRVYSIQDEHNFHCGTSLEKHFTFKKANYIGSLEYITDDFKYLDFYTKTITLYQELDSYNKDPFDLVDEITYSTLMDIHNIFSIKEIFSSFTKEDGLIRNFTGYTDTALVFPEKVSVELYMKDHRMKVYYTDNPTKIIFSGFLFYEGDKDD